LERQQLKHQVTIDGNEAAAYIAHRTNEVIAIYPITPSSPMGEWADAWSCSGERKYESDDPSLNWQSTIRNPHSAIEKSTPRRKRSTWLPMNSSSFRPMAAHEKSARESPHTGNPAY